MERVSGTPLKTELGRGTASYRAPELLSPIATFNETVDIWALGCVLFEVISGQRAFNDDWYVQVYARQNQKLPVPIDAFVDANLRIPLINLVREMLELRADRRPHASHLRSLFDIMNETGSFESRSDEVPTLYSRICQTQGDQMSAGPSRSIVFSVPYERNPFFTGRDRFLDTLFRELRDTQPNRYNHRIALYGLGGIGKTQTALEYAYRYREDYAYVFWISGIDRPELFSAFSRIARLLRCGLSLMRPEEIAQKIRLWLEANENWLLIIDNLDDIDVISGYLPQSNGSGHTIITTRNTNTDGIPATGLEVREMDRDNAAMFLLGRIKVDDLTVEIKAEAYKIVDVLGGLPLAIEQAAGYIKEPENISSYLPIFQRSRRQMLGRRLAGNHIYRHTVATTWLLSFERLEKTCPNAGTLLQYFSFMNPDEILVDYLRAGAAALPPSLRRLIEDPFEWGEVIDALEQSSLIRISVRDNKFSIHRLLQAVIQDGLETASRYEIETVILDMGLNSFPSLNDRRERIDVCRQFRSQVVACLERIKTESPRWADLAHRVALFLFSEGIYVEASHWWGLELALRQRLGLGQQHPDTLRSMDNLAISFGNLGQFKEAADLHAETLNLRKRVLGPEHPDTLWSMHSVADSYGSLGQFKEAAKLHAETFESEEKGSRARTS